MVILLLMLACGGGERHPSIVQDTRILSIVADPPEARPGETISITVLVADPKLRGVEVLIWTCGLYEGECAESLMPFNDWAIVTTTHSIDTPRYNAQNPISSWLAEQGRVYREVPDDAAEIFEYLNPIPVAMYALACEPGLCPIIDEVREAREVNSADSDLKERLADPTLWMHTLPMAGVSMAAQQFLVSNEDDDFRNKNPSFDPRFAQGKEVTIRIPAGGEVEVAFYVDDPNGGRIYAYAYTTMGEFEERRVKEDDNGIRNWLMAPNQPGEGRVYMVFEDRDGGSALWTRGIEVY